MARRPDFLVLAIDIGSSSVRSAIFDDRARVVKETSAKREYAIHYGADGSAELSPQQLYRAAKSCLAETLEHWRATPATRRIPIRAVSGSSFWHSLLALDRAGRPITPVLTWADARSNPDALQLREKFSEREIQLRTGCMLRASFWPAKLRWLRRSDPSLFKRATAWVSPAAWLFGRLFGAENTSHSMASGTGLYDLRLRNWDTDLCAACRIDSRQLREIGDSASASRGEKDLRHARIFAAVGDGAASNLGSEADRTGVVAINIGTSAAARVIERRSAAQSRKIPEGLFRYVVDAERTLLGGAISNGGNLRKWCMRELQLGGDAEAERALSRNRAATDSLTVLPFWVQERAPTWPEGLHGTISGLTPTTAAADILRAATTSTYYRLADIVDRIESAAGGVEQVIVSGGILKSPASLPILADCLGRDIHVCRELESSLRGAAIHALEQLGYAVSTLRAGRKIRHQPNLAGKHRARRERQSALETQLSRTPMESG